MKNYFKKMVYVIGMMGIISPSQLFLYNPKKPFSLNMKDLKRLKK